MLVLCYCTFILGFSLAGKGPVLFVFFTVFGAVDSKEKETSSRKDVASVVCLCKLLILGTRVRKSLMNQA